MADPGAAEEAESALPSPRHLAMALVLVGALAWLHMFNRAWFHFVAELLPLILGSVMFIVAQQTGRLARHAFVPCLAAAFFWASVLGIFQVTVAERLLDIQAFPDEAPWLLELCSHTLLALGLLLATGCKPGSLLEKYLPVGLGLISALLAALIFLDGFPALFVKGGIFSPFKIAWNWMLVMVYAAAGWLLYQQRARAELGLYHAMLAIVFLLVLSELSFSTQETNIGFFNILGHLGQLGAYWLMLAVVNQQLLLMPRRLLRRQAQLLHDVTSQVPGLAWQLQRSAEGAYHFTFVSAGAADIFELTIE